MTRRQEEGWAASVSGSQLDTRTSELLSVSPEARLTVPGLTVLCHPDPERRGEVAVLGEPGAEPVRLSRLEPLFAGAGEGASFRPLQESHLSRRPLLLTAGDEPGGVTLLRAGSPTAVTVAGEVVEHRRTFRAAEVERGVVLVLSQRVALLLHRVEPVPAAPAGDDGSGLLGTSAAMARLRRELRDVAALTVPVLLQGETGTGKELAAHAIHRNGPRSRGPFLAVNMGALPPTLAAAELFGAARGAYTGAAREKVGLFRSAHGGTLFLDEIGEAPPEVQVLLLRVLESGEIQPVGSVQSRKVDVRVVAATDADLPAAIRAGRFRAPLLHRLAGYEIRLPPLRQRREDVPLLFDRFLRLELQELAGPAPSPLPAALVARLTDHDWPGNVRELRNVARRLAVATRGGADAGQLAATAEELLASSPMSGEEEAAVEAPAPPSPAAAAGGRRPESVGEEELLAALEAHRWSPQPTARALGISRAALYRLIEDDPRVPKASRLTPEEIRAALEQAGGDTAAAALALRVSPQALKRRMTALDLP